MFSIVFCKQQSVWAQISILLIKLLKSYCMPYITYAYEATPFTKTDIHRL